MEEKDKKIGKSVKLLPSTIKSVQEIADKDHQGNFNGALERSVIEGVKVIKKKK